METKHYYNYYEQQQRNNVVRQTTANPWARISTTTNSDIIGIVFTILGG